MEKENKMEIKEKLINFAVSSYDGDTPYSMLPKQALAKMKQLEDIEKKWVFIEGEHKNASLLTESDLIEAEEQNFTIHLMDALAGGNDPIIDIKFETNKAEKGVFIQVKTNDYAKIVSIDVGEKDIIETLHNRKVIVKALEKQLDSLAAQQIKDLKKVLNA